MSHRGKVPAIALLLLLSVSAVWAGNANLIVGKRSLDDDAFWEPLEEQNVYGVNVDWAPEDWPVHLQFGASLSSDDGQVSRSGETIDADVEIRELSFGLVRIWEGHRLLRPYLGGGLSTVMAEIDATLGSESESFDDDSFGFFVNGGLYLRFGERFNVGIDGRILHLTDLSLEGESFDADYLQLGLLLGWGW